MCIYIVHTALFENRPIRFLSCFWQFPEKLQISKFEYFTEIFIFLPCKIFILLSQEGKRSKYKAKGECPPPAWLMPVETC